MNSQLFSLLFLSLFSLSSIYGSTSSFTSNADAFFKKYVSFGKVNYALIKQDPELLNNLLSAIANQNRGSISGNEKKAFYINAYNILVIKSVIDAYPVYGPLKVPGFFKTRKHKIAGESLTLEQIEKTRMSAKQDPRLHFALVCAANGCPKLANYAFKAASLNAQLDRITQQAMDNKSFLRVNHQTKTVQLSQIFEWYKADFVGFSGSNLQYINRYRSESIPADYKLSFYTYDWRLNEKKS